MIKNYQILKEQINYAVSNSGLDIGAAYFILKDILFNLERMYYAQINKEFLEESENETESDKIHKETDGELTNYHSPKRKEAFHARHNHSTYPTIYCRFCKQQ